MSKKDSNQMPQIEEFLKAGVHFGHKTSRWDPKMKPYIYTEKGGVHIIDVVKTIEMTEVALDAIRAASEEGYILVIGTKGQAASLVSKIGAESGAFYVNKRWPGGLFTNFAMIKRSISKLIKMEENSASGGVGLVKKERLMQEREITRLNGIYSGIKFMDRLPTLIVVIDSKVERLAIKEAKAAKIPMVALLDTNCDPDPITYPIPANDDSIKSIELFINLFSSAIAGSRNADAVVALRNSHDAKLVQLKQDFESAAEKKKANEEMEKERMKNLREGKEEAETAADSKARVVRLVERAEPTTRVGKAAKASAPKASEERAETIESLKVPARTKAALEAAGYKNLSQLQKLSKVELVAIKGVGEKAADTILEALK